MKKEYSLLNKSLILIITTCIGLIIAGIKTYFIDIPTYESVSELVVQLPQNEQRTVNNDQETNDLMINTYQHLLKSQTVLKHSVYELEKEGIHTKVDTLKQKLSITGTKKSQVLKILIKDNDPVQAKKINQVITEVFRAELPKLMQISKVEIVSPANFQSVPSSPNHMKTLYWGGGIGLLVGILILLMQWINQRLLTSRWVIRRLQAPIIGSIQSMTKREQSVRIHRTEEVIPEEVDQRTRDLSETNEMVDRLLSQETQNYDTLVRRRRKR